MGALFTTSLRWRLARLHSKTVGGPSGGHHWMSGLTNGCRAPDVVVVHGIMHSHLHLSAQWTLGPCRESIRRIPASLSL